MANPLEGYNIQWVGSPNYTPGRQLPIDHQTYHHAAGFSLANVDATFANPSRQASSTFAVQGREIHQYVQISDTPWTDGNWYSNNSGVTVEMVNSGGEPDWPIDEVTFDTAARLAAWVQMELGLGDLYYNGTEGTLYRHCDLSPTACLPEEITELLTPSGWKLLKDVEVGDTVAQVHCDDLNVSWGVVRGKVEPYEHDTWQGGDLEATADHRMLGVGSRGNIQHLTWNDFKTDTNQLGIPNAGQYDGSGLPLSEKEIQLLCAIQADGCYEFDTRVKNTDGFSSVHFHLKKERKIELLESILTELGYAYQKGSRSDGTTSIRAKRDLYEWAEQYLSNKKFTWEWLELSKDQAAIFLDSLLDWGGCREGNDYSSSNRDNIDIVTAIAALNGIGTRANGTKRVSFTAPYRYVSIGTEWHRNRKECSKSKVSCVTVDTGYILIRQHGRTTVVGNCPGPWFKANTQRFCDLVNSYIHGNAPQPAPAPTPAPAPEPEPEAPYDFGGTYKCQVNGLRIRRSPSLSGAVDGYYNAGETVNLDNDYYIADGYVWGTYESWGGTREYIAVGKNTGQPEADDFLIKV